MWYVIEPSRDALFFNILCHWKETEVAVLPAVVLTHDIKRHIQTGEGGDLIHLMGKNGSEEKDDINLWMKEAK